MHVQKRCNFSELALYRAMCLNREQAESFWGDSEEISMSASTRDLKLNQINFSSKIKWSSTNYFSPKESET